MKRVGVQPRCVWDRPSEGSPEMKDHRFHPRNKQSPTDKRRRSHGHGQDKRPELARRHLDVAGPDLLREMLKPMAETLMGAEADSIYGAEYGEVSPGRADPGSPYRGPSGGSGPRRWPGVKLSTMASAVHPYSTLAEFFKRAAGAVMTPKLFERVF